VRINYKGFLLTWCLSALILFSNLKADAQTWSIGLYLNGINLHLKKPVNHEHFHRTLTKNKRLVYNLGWGFRISYFVKEYAGLTITQAFVPYDCGNKFFGMTHAGVFLSTRHFNQSKHEGILIGGPLMFYRKNWNTLPGYIDDKVFQQSKNKAWQYKFVWHGGFLEYQYHYNQDNAVGLHIMPGIPELISVSALHTSFIK
jgi:hypothetical protein